MPLYDLLADVSMQAGVQELTPYESVMKLDTHARAQTLQSLAPESIASITLFSAVHGPSSAGPLPAGNARPLWFYGAGGSSRAGRAERVERQEERGKGGWRRGGSGAIEKGCGQSSPPNDVE